MSGQSGLTGPTTETLARILEARLLSGEWPPGARLPSERQLAERFSVGRPMVREVLRTLSERGLVVTLPGRGTYVREVQPSDGMEAREALARRGVLTAHHLIDARRALESEAAALASIAPGDAELRLLGDVVTALESADDFAVTAELDLAFHGLVVSMSRNPVLEMTFSSMRSLTYALIVRSHADQQVHRTSLPYHRKVAEAIAAGDAARARRAMEQHFTSGQRHYGRDLDVSLTEALRTRADGRSDVACLLRRASSSVSLDKTPAPLRETDPARRRGPRRPGSSRSRPGHPGRSQAPTTSSGALPDFDRKGCHDKETAGPAPPRVAAGAQRRARRHVSRRLRGSFVQLVQRGKRHGLETGALHDRAVP